MATNFEDTEDNHIITYKFRVTDSNECISLTQQQLDRIPYLTALVEHKDDFSSCQNENGEYLLNQPFQYKWFIPILRLITSQQPYTLVTETPEDENIVDTLQLFDYLGMHLFTPPLLKGKDLVLSNPTNETRHVEYHRANLSEARNTAAQFIISLSQNEYDLHEIDTLQSVYDLIKIIFLNKDVFSSRFRHHTRTIINECCISFFSVEQRSELPTIDEIAESSTTDSWFYLYIDDQSVPENFQNAFAWKSVYKLTEENNTNSNLDSLGANSIDMLPDADPHPITFDHFLDHEYLEPIEDFLLPLFITTTRYYFNRYIPRLFTMHNRPSSRIQNRNIKEEYISEAKSARSERFNTLPKRSNVDKFKHRFGPKVQKYR